VEFLVDQQDLLHLDDVGMVEFPQGFDLPQLEALLPVLVLALHLLDRHHFVGLVVDCLEDSSKGSISQDAYYFIFLHN
jgi:hypothetical protein